MKTHLTPLAIIIIFASAFCIYAQKENSYWYFGKYAGIRFNTPDGNPVVINDGQINTTEGTASVSDKDGNLLFYTDGVTVFNKNHQVMQNGTGLLGHESCSQSALIVPNPEDPGIYYIFTPGIAESLSGDKKDARGVNYSIVDMKLDNGLGAVTTKNVELYKPSCEKLTAVKNMLDNSIWVLSHEWDTDAFYAYRVTGKGVGTMPVISHTGRSHSSNIRTAATGRMSASPDGTLLAVTVPWVKDKDSLEVDGDFEIFDFDAITGIVSNPRSLRVKTPTYASAFSPDGTRLYIRLNNETVQYNLNLCNWEDVIKSRTVVGTDNCPNYNAIELAPNGKIYCIVDYSKYLSVINYPDRPGVSCVFANNAIDLGSGSGKWGLPTFLQSFYNGRRAIKSYVELCEGDTLRLSAKFSEPFDKDSYQWTGPNGFSSKSETVVIPYARPEMSGEYKCSVTLRTEKVDSASFCVTVHPKPVVTIEPNTHYVVVCDSDRIILKAFPKGDGLTYKWNTGEATPDITVTKSGIYSVLVTNASGCSDSNKINAVIGSKPDVKIIAPGGVDLCKGDSLLLEANNDFPKYSWSTGKDTKNIYVSQPGRYYLTVYDTAGCSATDSIEVTWKIISLKLKNFFFGNTCNFIESVMADTLVNTTNEPLVIDSLYLKNNDPAFKLVVNATLPAIIAPNEKFIYGIKCLTTDNANHSDILTARVSSPCNFDLITAVMAEGRAPVLFTLIPDTNGSIGKNMCIPVYGEINCNGYNRTFQKVVFVVALDATVFDVLSVTKGTILSNIVQGGKRLVTVKLDNITLSETRALLTELCGLILLGMKDSTNVDITSITTDPALAWAPDNGILSLDKICVKNLRSVQTLIKPQFTLSPNPAKDIIEIRQENMAEGSASILVYNASGSKVYSSYWQQGNATMSIPVSGFSQGLYNVVIVTGQDVFALPVIVVN